MWEHRAQRSVTPTLTKLPVERNGSHTLAGPGPLEGTRAAPRPDQGWASGGGGGGAPKNAGSPLDGPDQNLGGGAEKSGLPSLCIPRA